MYSLVVENIKCIIAAGGLGTRLQEFRGNKSTKILLDVNGTPMINRQISQLVNWGMRKFVIITNPEYFNMIQEVTLGEFKDLEIIVVDDGSEKSSRKVVDSFKKNISIKYFFIENRGPALARNYGVNKSEGEWIIFFDSDCTIPKNYFFEVNKFLEKNKIDFYGGPDMMDKSFSYLQKSINYSMTSFLTTGGIRGSKKSIDKFLPRSFNMGVKKNAFDEVDGFSDIRQ